MSVENRTTAVKNVVIMIAAGRDFHNFNLAFRNNPGYRVVAFTAAQIPNIAGRSYPPALAGRPLSRWYPYPARGRLGSGTIWEPGR